MNGAEARAAVRRTQHWIDGEWVDSADGATFDTVDPATGERIASVAAGGPEDVDRAVSAARRAFESGAWPAMGPRDRGRALHRIADAIDAHADALAALETLDSGKVLNEVRHGDVPGAAETFRYFAGWPDKLTGETIPTQTGGRYFCYTKREPVGVCGQIIPWNFPLLMAAWKIAPALAAGNTVVLKPAEQTPLSALALADLIADAGIPPGVVNIVNGYGETAGDAIVKHPGVAKIAFTGEHRTAQTIMANAASTLKRCTFELGGKSPNVVFADADLGRAVRGASVGIFYNQGQVCTAGSRLFVERSVHDRFVDDLVAHTKTKRRVGDPFADGTTQGALVSEAHFEKVMGYIETGASDDGATCVVGGKRHGDRGYFVEPTIFTDVHNDMRIAREEIFGPVLSVIPFDDFDDVLRQSNDTDYGLAAAIWTRDIERAHRFADAVKAGTVWINCVGTFDVGAPFGGVKFSGQGREMGRVGVEAYTELKTVWVRTLKA